MIALTKAKDRNLISKYGKLKGWDICNSLGLPSFGDVYILSDYIDEKDPKIKEIFGIDKIIYGNFQMPNKPFGIMMNIYEDKFCVFEVWNIERSINKTIELDR